MILPAGIDHAGHMNTGESLKDQAIVALAANKSDKVSISSMSLDVLHVAEPAGAPLSSLPAVPPHRQFAGCLFTDYVFTQRPPLGRHVARFSAADLHRHQPRWPGLFTVLLWLIRHHARYARLSR
jgi:hypothetical protein